MASQRDTAFEAFYESLSDKGDIGGRELIRKAWEAGRRYESKRRDAIVAMSPARRGIPALWSGPFTADD